MINPPSEISSLLFSKLDALIQVYTTRITPPPEYTNVSSVINLFSNEPRFKTYIITKETSRKGVIHLHIRFSIALQEISVRNILKDSLQFLNGNGCYQLAKIKQKVNKKLEIVYKNKQTKKIDPDSIWKSACYICKDGFILDQRGYEPKELHVLQKIGESLKPEYVTNRRQPIFLQIIEHYDLKPCDINRTTYIPTLVSRISSYYYETLRKYPSRASVNACLHNIYCHLNKYYRDWYNLRASDDFRDFAYSFFKEPTNNYLFEGYDPGLDSD